MSYIFLQGQCRPLCRYDFLDVGEVEENMRRAQACKKIRHFIVDPDLAKLITQHLRPEDAKTIIFECNPGMYVYKKSNTDGINIWVFVLLQVSLVYNKLLFLTGVP